MSVNDGKKLMVFGLGFAQQDSRRMQQLLRHYNRLPSNPTNRTSLFIELNNLAKELMTDEAAQDQIQQLTEWMENGGDFPLGVAPDPLSGDTASTRQRHRSNLSARPQYHGRGRIRARGRGRTLNDPPEVDDQDEDTSEPLVDSENELGGDFTEARMSQVYGKGRAWNDPPEPVSSDEEEEEEEEEEDDDDDDDGIEGTSGREPSTDHTALANPYSGAHSRNGNEGLLESESENGETQLQSNTSEPSDAVNMSQHDASMDPDAANKTKAIECPICLEEYPPTGFPRGRTVTELCDHPDKACLQCLNSSITVMVERGAIHLLACPICPQKLSRKHMEEYASKEVYNRYEYLKQQSEIPGHWISCMNTHCGGSQPHESEDPKMICNHCSFATCAKHKRPWHQGQTCGEFDLDDAQIERLEEEEATAKLLAKESTSICPKCRQGITKVDGCDHMRCQCGEEWCYVCSCSWENILRLGDVAHATFCIYHPNKVNLTQAQQEATRRRILGLVHGGEVSAELAKARDELRERRRVEIRAKALEAAEARMKEGTEQKRSIATPPEKKKKRVKLVAPWEEGGWTKKAL